ncbi:MAG: DUF2330 domain-containing protein [Sandaracinaceae bacterium]
MKRTTAMAAVAGAGLLLGAQPASACGGCFGPNGQPTVVTAHRMAVSLGTMSTVLWDQFEYAGAAEDFVWVLPVAGSDDVTVELADNAFFLALQQSTAIQMQGPFRSTGGGGGGGGFGCGDASAAGIAREDGPSSPPVQVFHEGTVGPYETATIGSEDPEALLTWMNERGYQVPDPMLPTITYYVEQGMNFVALRLSPGESVTRMQPVRVSSRGMNVSFPLRMVAAGVSDFVALELYVIAEGRYEAANFPNGEVDRNQIVYDWATQTYNYDDLADQVIFSNAGRTWLTEFADAVDPFTIMSFTERDEDGTLHSAAQDWTIATRSISAPSVTRMRANLPVQALSDDLILAASPGPALPGLIQVTRDVNWETASAAGALERRDTRLAALPVWPLAVILVAGAGLIRRRRSPVA